MNNGSLAVALGLKSRQLNRYAVCRHLSKYLEEYLPSNRNRDIASEVQHGQVGEA